MNFVSTPNIPIGFISHCLIGGMHRHTIADLAGLGITAITSPPYGNGLIAGHIDMVCHHLGGNKLIVYPYDTHFIAALENFKIDVVYPTEIMQEKYPFDVLLNAARVGDYLICNRAHTSAVLLNSFTPDNIIDTAQGYAKCSTLVVSSNAIITSDPGIAKNALKKGIDVLHIRQGDITLDGYAYGFIGGCGTLISEKVMYFTGDIYTHRDGALIVEYLRTWNIDAVCGSEKTLVDVGSIIPLIER